MNRKGFTLIELLVTGMILFIAIIMVVSVGGVFYQTVTKNTEQIEIIDQNDEVVDQDTNIKEAPPIEKTEEGDNKKL